jgi:hypothetical protein
MADRLGKKQTLALACIISIAAVFIQIFAKESAVLMTGKVHRLYHE